MLYINKSSNIYKFIRIGLSEIIWILCGGLVVYIYVFRNINFYIEYYNFIKEPQLIVFYGFPLIFISIAIKNIIDLLFYSYLKVNFNLEEFSFRFSKINFNSILFF